MPNIFSLKSIKKNAALLVQDENIRRYIMLLFSQGMNFIAALLNNILLAQLMTEVDFGSYKYGHNFLSFITTIILFGLPYSASRLLAQNSSDARERKIIGTTIKNMITLSLAFSLLILAFIIVAGFIGVEVNSILFYCIPCITLIVLQQSQLTMLQGTGKIKGISIQTFVPSGVMLLCLLVFFVAGVRSLNFTSVWLLFCLGYLIAQVITLQITKPIFRGRDPDIQCELVQEYRINGRNIYLGSLLGVASTHCVNFILGSISEMSEYAVYALAWSLAAVLQMIPSAMGTVMFRKNAAAGRIPYKVIIFTGFFSGMLYFLFVGMLHIMIPILFPATYLDAIWMGAILGFAMIINGIGDFFNRFISANGYGNYIKNGALMTGIINIFGSVVFLKYWKIDGVIAVRVLASTAYLTMMIFYYIRVLKEEGR